MSTAIKKRFYTRKLKFLAALLLAGLLTLPPLVNLFITSAHAASLTNYKMQIGDSRAGVATYHNFTFITPSTTSIKTITFQYCTTASGVCTAPAGMILAASPTLGTVTGIAGTTYTPTSSSGTCTGSGNTNCTLTLTVTTPAAQTGGATVVVPFVTGITNPTTTNSSYYVLITTKDVSVATIDGPNAAAFAILATTSVAVTATVDPNLTFTVAGVSSGGTVNGATTNVTTTAATIPFGNLTPGGSSAIGAQDLTITTNAGSGYIITASHSANAVSGNPPLVSGTNQINGFTGTNATPSTWSAPSGNANSSSGFFGYTTNSTTPCTGSASRFSSNKWAGTTTFGQEVDCSTSATPQAGTTTRVGWQAQVDAVQPAGSYTGTVILIATPSY